MAVVDAINGDRDLLAARTGKRGVDVAVGIDGGIRHRMKAVSDGHGDADFTRVAAVSVGSDDDASGRGPFGNASHDELLGTDDDGSVDVTEMYRRATHSAGPQAVAEDADLASGQSAVRLDRVNLRIPVHFQCGHEVGLVFHPGLVSCCLARA